MIKSHGTRWPIGLAAVAAILATAACVVSDARSAELERYLTPRSLRITDAVLEHDLSLMRAWREKLDALRAQTSDPWRDAAARAWLTAAYEEYTDDDRNGFAASAFEHAVRIISEVESQAKPVDAENVPRTSRPSRAPKFGPGLWTTLDSLKTHPGFRCAAADVARLEVELAWAVNESLDQGDCNVEPMVAVAESLARRARIAADDCLPEPEPQPAPKPEPAPAPVPERLVIHVPTSVHFAVNRSDVGPQSREVIDVIAAVLDSFPSVTLVLEGHTDSRGSVQYNIELSRKRVTAVRDAFVAAGIDASRIQLEWKGEEDLLVEETSKRNLARNRRVDMIFRDPMGRDIEVTRQERDLQIESD